MAPRRTIRKVLLGCGLLTAFVVFGGVLSEAAFRAIKASFGSPPLYQYDEDLGWAPIPNVSYDFPEEPANGGADGILYATNHLGFRGWGNPAANRPRILFVGDSFTQDANMSNGAAYFSQVAEMLPVEVFAIGGGGYGTLQEVLTLERYWHLIEPTHVIIQFCSNDYSNNHYDSETFSIVRNQKHFRPYLVDGEIVFRDSALYRLLYRSSMLFRFVDQRIQNLQYATAGGYSKLDDEPHIQSLHHAAVEVTREILQRAQRLGSGSVKWYMFSCDVASPDWLHIAREEGFAPIVGVPEAVEAAKKRGQSVHSSDGAHWNNLGHEIAGGVIAEFFARELATRESALGGE